MSTAAPNKPTGGYDVGRPHGVCAVCLQPLSPDEKLMAALRETAIGFERVDCMLTCWEKLDRAGIVANWKTVMPRSEAKKKVFVDDEVLCDLFQKLSEVTEPVKLNFRFVLGLILMRKKMLVYDRSEKKENREIWTMHLKGRDESLELVNPQLTEEQMQEVSGQLGQILNEEL